MDAGKGTDGLALIFAAILEEDKSEEWCRDKARLIWPRFATSDSMSLPSDKALLLRWLENMT